MNKRCRAIMDELILNGELEEITWFKFAPKQELKLRLKDMLEDEVDEKYLLSEKLVSYFEKHKEEQKEKGNGFGWQPLDKNSEISLTITNPGKTRPNETYIKLEQTHTLNIKGNDSIKRIYSSDGLCPSLTTMQGGHREPKVSIEDKYIFRKLTERECFRLQGFDDSFIFPAKMSSTQLYKQAGNGMSRNILDMIFTQIFKSKNFDLSSNS